MKQFKQKTWKQLIGEIALILVIFITFISLMYVCAPAYS